PSCHGPPASHSPPTRADCGGGYHACVASRSSPRCGFAICGVASITVPYRHRHEARNERMDSQTARTLMVDGQVRPNKVTDPRIIAAMRRIAREEFVPPQL